MKFLLLNYLQNPSPYEFGISCCFISQINTPLSFYNPGDVSSQIRRGKRDNLG